MININSEVTQAIQKAIKRQGSPEYKVSDTIQPTIEVNPQIIKNVFGKESEAINSTSSTIYTTPTTQDFYLTSVTLSTIKDVTSTSVASKIRVTINGLAFTLLEIASLSLTPQSQINSLVLTHPLKVDRGTIITVTNSTNVGNITSWGGITGFLDETAGY
jgi:hypothetical protein